MDHDCPRCEGEETSLPGFIQEEQDHEQWLESLEKEREYPCEDPLAEAMAMEMIRYYEEDIRLGIINGNMYAN